MCSLLTGLIAAPFTPFLPDGELNLAAVPRLAGLLERNGVNGAFICGTTGEGCSLTGEERRRTAEAWRAAASSRLKLIVHVGHLSLRESCALARHAQATGADAIATIAPNFFKPATAADLVEWCREVAAAAPALPFYYYHMPAMTGVAISATAFLTEADGRIPTLAGVKFTDEDLRDFEAARRFAGDRYALLFGRDERLLSGLECGADGAVGSTYNYAAPLFTGIMRARRENDQAGAAAGQLQARTFIDIMSRAGGLPAGKAIMKLIGVDCGPVRRPLRTLLPAQEEELRSALQAIGFFAYASKA